MKIDLPQLDYERSAEAVARNADKLKAALAAVDGAREALKGLTQANQALCEHPKKRDVYDPGYAGGGHDGYLCPACGKRGYF